MYDINQIATRAANVKKPNKATAFAMVKNLAEKPADLETLAALYAYFLPPIPKTAKTPEEWIFKAVAKKDVRHYLKYAYSDGKRLIGTDGHRLHFAPTSLPEGYYDSQLNLCDVDARYPDVDRVIPDKAETLNGFTLDSCEVQEVGRYTAVNLFKDLWVDRRYALDAMNSNPKAGCTIECYTNAESPIRLTGPFPETVAVIMPIRV